MNVADSILDQVFTSAETKWFQKLRQIATKVRVHKTVFRTIGILVVYFRKDVNVVWPRCIDPCRGSSDGRIRNRETVKASGLQDTCNLLKPNPRSPHMLHGLRRHDEVKTSVHKVKVL